MGVNDFVISYMVNEHKINTIEILIYIFFAFLALFFTTPHLTSEYIHKPDDSVLVGLPAYFEDYYYYLDQFYQGSQGKWLTENHFSIERFPPKLIYFNNLLLGNIGGKFHLEAFQSYQVFGILFKFAFILFTYPLIFCFFPKNAYHRVSAYLLFLISNSFPSIITENGHLSVQPTLPLLRTSSRVLERFGTAPNGMLVNLLFILLLFSMIHLVHKKSAKKKEILFLEIIMIPAFILVCLGDLVLAIYIVLIGSLILFLQKDVPLSLRRNFKILLAFFSIITGMYLLYTLLIINRDPVYQLANNWDISQYLQQIKAIKIQGMLREFWLLFSFGLLGFVVLIKKKSKTIYEYIGLGTIILSFFGYFFPLIFQIPVPGFRSLFPISYVFLSVLVIISLHQISLFFKQKTIFYILLFAVLALNLSSFIPSWWKEFQPVQEPEYHFAYIPNEIYQGFLFLRNAEPLDGNVVASAFTEMDLMIPGLTGRYTYSGHMLTTYDVKKKDGAVANLFYLWADTPETHEFFKKNNIRFIFITKYSDSVNLFKYYYPFLEVVFENPSLTIFRFNE